MTRKGVDPELVERTLSGRESWYRARVAAQARSPHATWIEFALNVPGWPKRTGWTREVLATACHCVGDKLEASRVLALTNDAGSFALMRTETPAAAAKLVTVTLESTHLWGRLWDLDVHGPRGRVSRRALGLPERACLLCEQPHARCIAEAAHPIDALRQAAEALGTASVAPTLENS